MKTRKRIYVELSDEQLDFITLQAKADRVSVNDEMAVMFYTQLDRMIRDHKEGYVIIPIY